MSYTNKPNEIRHSQAALRVEGFAVPRVQSLGYTADLNSEEVFELGNANAVEIVNGDPNVSLTIDVNDYGSIDFLNQISTNYIGQTGNTNDNTSDGTGFLPHAEFETAVTDFNVIIRETPDGTATRNAWFSNCTLDSISGNFQIDGFATESYSFGGASQVWFLGTKAGFLAIPLEFASDTSLAAVTGGFEGDLTINISDARVYGNGVLVGDTTVTTSGNVTGTGFSAGVRYRLLANVTAPTPFPEEYKTDSDIGGIKEREVEIVMWDGTDVPSFGEDTTGDTDTLLRLQSVDYELSLDREELRQLYTGLYSRTVNETSITASISALDSDLQLWAYGTGNREDWIDGSAIDELSLSNFQEMSDISLRIAVFRSPAARTAGDVLKYILLQNGKVTSVGDSFDVPGRGTVNMEVSFSSITFVGTGEEGRVGE